MMDMTTFQSGIYAIKDYIYKKNQKEYVINYLDQIPLYLSHFKQVQTIGDSNIKIYNNFECPFDQHCIWVHYEQSIYTKITIIINIDGLDKCEALKAVANSFCQTIPTNVGNFS